MKLKGMILSALFAALTIVGGLIKIPLPPAQFTLQLLFVLLSGILLGKKYGSISQIIYLLLGLVGLPIFASGGGISYILNPTFGFIVGFILTSYFSGLIVEKKIIKKNKLLNYILACFTGTLVCYLIGTPYLFLAMNLFLHKPMSISNAIYYGMILYIPWDIIKIIVASMLGNKICSIKSLQI